MSSEETYVATTDDFEIAWNGETGSPYVDMKIHDDSRPEDMPTVVVSVGMTIDEAKQLVARLTKSIEKAETAVSLAYPGPTTPTSQM